MVTRCGGLSSLGWTGRPHAPPRKESRDLPPQPRAHRQLAPALRRPPRHVNNTQGDTPTHLQHQGAAGISSLAHSAHKTQYTHNTHTDTHMHTHLQHQGARIESIQMLKWDVRASSLNPPNSWLGCGKGGVVYGSVCLAGGPSPKAIKQWARLQRAGKGWRRNFTMHSGSHRAGKQSHSSRAHTEALAQYASCNPQTTRHCRQTRASVVSLYKAE